MKMSMFGIYDEKSLSYGTPFFQPQVGQGMRTFSDLAKDAQSSISKHPEDYSLYHLGDYDDFTGKIVSFDVPHLLQRATEGLVSVL